MVLICITPVALLVWWFVNALTICLADLPYTMQCSLTVSFAFLNERCWVRRISLMCQALVAPQMHVLVLLMFLTVSVMSLSYLLSLSYLGCRCTTSWNACALAVDTWWRVETLLRFALPLFTLGSDSAFPLNVGCSVFLIHRGSLGVKYLVCTCWSGCLCLAGNLVVWSLSGWNDGVVRHYTWCNVPIRNRDV